MLRGTAQRFVCANICRPKATSNELFVVGSTNVGKSSFINRLMDRIERRSAGLTVSHFPGTTLDIVSFPLNSGATVHDTPGTNTVPLFVSTYVSMREHHLLLRYQA